MSAWRRAAGVIAAALGLSACNQAFVPVQAPTAWRANTGVRVDAMKVGPQGAAEQEKEGAMRLLLTMHAPADAQIAAVRLTRTTRRPCSGGARALYVTVDGAPEAPLPVPIEGEHGVVVAFRTAPEEALEGPTAVDVVMEQHEHLSCVRTELGPARDWHRPQPALEGELTGGAALRPPGEVGSPWMVEERVGALLDQVDLGAGLRAGAASCTGCGSGPAVLLGPSAAATLFPYTAGPMAVGIAVTYASLLAMLNSSTDSPGALPHVGEWYQVPGLALQLDWLAPPRSSRVRLRGRDFSDWGVEVFEQLWIPTMHAERPTAVIGLGLVSRLAL